nr:hypothetical protein [Tanacetum cinerariifolium]
MRTRSSSNLPVVSPPNLSTSNPKRRNRRRSKQPFILEESHIDTMVDQRTIAELLHAPTEGYAEAIVVPSILAEQFELKHSLINMMTSDQFFGLEKDNPHDHIQISKLTHTVNQQTSVVTTAMTAILKQFQATPPPAFVKAIEKICVTCGGAHPYYQCLAAGGNTFPELRDNIQGYVAAATVNYNQEQSYQAPTQHNQVVPLNGLEKVKRMNEANMKSMQTQINIVKNELRNEMKNSIQASMSNQTNKLKNMMASFFQMNTASTSGSGSLPSNTVANPKGELKAITTRSGIVLDRPFVPTLPLFINLGEDERVEETLTDQDLSEYTIKKLPEKLGDPGKFLIPCDFSELKCKALADLARIARDVFVSVGKFTFLTDFVIVDYESDPRGPLILGRPFLRTARALIGVHGEEMILRDGDERLTLNMRHDTSSYSNQPQKESINLINVFNDSNEDFLEDLFLTNQPSGNPTFSSHPELTSPEVKDDIFEPEGGNVLPEKLLDLDSTKDLHPPLHDIDSSLKDLIDQSNIADLNDNLVDSMPEMFTDEYALYYSSPPIFNEYNDDLFEVEYDTKNLYDDPFDSNGEKIKESKLLIDELNIPCDFLFPSEYNSFLSVDFSRVDALPSTNNEDKGNWVKLSDPKQALRGRHPMLILSF